MPLRIHALGNRAGVRVPGPPGHDRGPAPAALTPRRTDYSVAMHVRDATPRDLGSIFAIYDREVLGGTATFETEPRTPAQRVEWFDAHDRARYPVIVAEEGGQVVGWARLYPWSPRPAYARTAENAVYVEAARRGRGVGAL